MSDRLLDISLRQLLALREAADAPTWTAAAERLGISQSALSQSMAELERRVGMPLFEPDGRRRRLRSQASEVLAFATRVTAQAADLRQRLDALRDGRRGRLRVGMIDAAALYRLPGAVGALRRQQPDVEVEVIVDSTTELMNRLTRGDLDVAVVVAPNRRLLADPTGYRARPLLEEPFYVYAPGEPTDRQAGRGARWVSYPRHSETRLLIDQALAAESTESGNPEVLVQLVRLGVGWAALPAQVAEQGTEPLRRVPGGPLLHRRLSAVERVDQPADEMRARLVDELLASAGTGSGGASERTA
jgi:DNA-binding transcriptional LysR family regulator